jgi:hypothetical protein
VDSFPTFIADLRIADSTSNVDLVAFADKICAFLGLLPSYFITLSQQEK